MSGFRKRENSWENGVWEREGSSCPMSPIPMENPGFSQDIHELLKDYELKYCFVDKYKGTGEEQPWDQPGIVPGSLGNQGGGSSLGCSPSSHPGMLFLPTPPFSRNSPLSQTPFLQGSFPFPKLFFNSSFPFFKSTFWRNPPHSQTPFLH